MSQEIIKPKTKNIRKRGFWKKRPKNHPLLIEVQLGKSVEELCNEHFGELDWNGNLDTAEVVKEIIKLNDTNIKFAVDTGGGHCQIIVLNSKADIDLDLDYWDEDDNYALDDNAASDCEHLNKIVCKLFGIVREKPEPKITDDQYVKKQICPFCLRKKIVTLDDCTWSNKTEMGCARCGETWFTETKTIVTGFSR